MDRQTLARTHKPGIRDSVPRHAKPRASPANSPVHPLLTLQRSIGNQAVQRLLRSSSIQTKLNLSQPGDRFEREADQVASTVTRSPVTGPGDRGSSAPPAISRVPGATAQRQETLPGQESAEPVQRFSRSPLRQHPQPDEAFAESGNPLRQHPQPDEQFTESRSSLRQHPRWDQQPGEAQSGHVQRDGSDTGGEMVQEQEDDAVQTEPDGNGAQRAAEGPAALSEHRHTLQRQAEAESVEKKEADEVQAKAADDTLQSAERDSPAAMRQPAAAPHFVERQTVETRRPVRVQTAFRVATPPRPAETKGSTILRKSHGPPHVTPNVAADIQNTLASGSPLPPSVRRFMEPRFQADFSRVRVHSDPKAAKLSHQLSARAFTYRSHVFFARDQYQPDTGEGKKLLAHELTHTLQQGAATRRKIEVSKVESPQVQRGVSDWIKDKLKRGLNWVADRLIPGYTLLNVILGKNLITGEAVSRSGVNIIRGYMRLSPIIGPILLNELEETSTLTQAGAWVEAQVAKFGINFNDIAHRLEAMWDEMSVLRGIDYNVAIFKKYLSPVLGPFQAFSAVVMGKVKELRFEGALRLVGATQLLAAMKKDPAAFKRLVDDPKLILKYFMNALKQGFSQFKDNFATHFKNALFGWLFGKAAEMGIEMPKEFSAAGLFHLVAQLVGATYKQIRAQVVTKLGPRGETIVSTLEKTFDVVKDLVTRGPIALWERVKSFLSNLKEMLFAKISELVTIEIIKAAVLKLVSMLNPVGALVQLVLGIYRVVKFFIDKWATIKQLASAMLDSITNVALGNIAGAAKYIESTMAKGLTLVISFLASILGLGGIADKVKGLIKKISDPVQLAIGKVVGWIVEQAKKLVGKFVSKLKGAERTPEEKEKALHSGVAAAEAVMNRYAGRKVAKLLVTPALAAIRLRYRLATLDVLPDGEYWTIEAAINPVQKKKTKAKTAESLAAAAALKVGDEIQIKGRKWWRARVNTIVPNSHIAYAGDAGTGQLGFSGYGRVWRIYNPAAGFKSGAAFEAIKTLLIWASYEDARQTLNYRAHGNFTTPSGKQWHHIHEQKATPKGPNTVKNLALTAMVNNQAFSRWFGQPQTGTFNVPLRQWLKGKPAEIHEQWGHRCIAAHGLSVSPHSTQFGPFQTIP